MSGMFFRSEKMNYYEMRVSYDSAWGALGHLGTISSVELEDLNQNIAVMMRPFVNYVKRCLSLNDRISFMRELMAKKDITVPIFDDYGIFMSNLKDGQEKSGDIYLEKLEADVNSKYSTLKRNTETLDQLNTRHLDLVEKKTVITLTKPILPQGFRNYISAGSSVAALASGIRFNYICGVLKNEDLIKFQKLLFRMSRGNSYLKVLNIPIEKDKDGNVINCRKEDNGTPIQMSLIFLAYSTSAAANTDVISNKYLKLADTFGVRRYTLPVDQQASEDEIAELNTEILNIIEVKKTTQTEIEELLKELSSKRGESPCVLIDELRLKVLREKCIYENFDRMRLKDRIFYARMWIPEEDEVKIRRMIAEFAKAFGFNPPELEIKDWAKLKKTPPTHYRTNEFTKPYLNIVETYGIPRYQEMNPAPFSIATFPYQFGVMFGDVGHGGLLFAGTSILVYLADELKRKKLVPKALLEIRYLFWFMGFMAFYCGFTYNEFFAIPLKLFTSCYNMNSPEIERHHSEEGCVYPIGMDPAWYMAKNEVSYFNSFKMKLSIVIGVAHMLMGIFIRGANNIYFKQPIDFIFEFIPQVVFMSSTFGYMCVCIFIKWSTDFTGRTPPSILNIFTGMGIATPETVLWGEPSGKEQTAFQQKMFMYAGLCVPIMLLVKPVLVYLTTKHEHEHHEAHGTHSDLKQKLLHGERELVELGQTKSFLHDFDHPAGQVDEDHGFGEIMIHQLIETIEFVLGSVSNTASYLRLWALSLAHSALATVFLNMTVLSGMKSGSALSIFIGFPVYVNATVGILMMMDLLECFLHTLRLHWVEFMGKFFKGDGRKFEPLSFHNYAEAVIEG